MKKISILLVLLVVTIITKSQSTITTKQDTSLVAFNMEQLLEKIGFENLIKMAFDTKKSNSTEAEAKKAEIRKSLAAIYGAGIDFKRKAVIYSITPHFQDYSKNLENFQMPTITFALPIANRKVIEDNITKIAPISKRDNKKEFIKNGSVSYLINGKNVIIITDKELISTTLPMKFSAFNQFNDVAYLGKVIKRDTIFIPIEKVEEVGKIEPKKLKPTIEIDKFVNGKIIRVYKPKAEPKTVIKSKKPEVDFETIPAPPLPMEQAATTVMEEKYAIDSVATKAKEAVETVKLEVENNKIEDTLTTEKKINETTKEIITYIPFTNAEREANDKKMQEEEEINYAKKAMDFMADLDTKLPYSSTHLDFKKVLESKDDIVMYGNGAFPNVGGTGFLSRYMYGISSMGGSVLNNTMPKSENSSIISTYNFEKGKIVMNMQAGCCGTYNEFLSKFYFPVTNFWPKELGTAKTIGSIKFNMNMPEMVNYYDAILPEMAKEEMKQIDFSLNKMEELFTGEIAATFNAAEPTDKNKKYPKIVFAIKLKDATKAVSILNRIASQNIKMANAYRFDADAQYLLVSTDKSIFTMPKTTYVNTTSTLSTNKGELILNIGKFISSITKDSKLKKPETKAIIDFFGTMQIINNSTEDGLFSSTMTMEMGDKNKNVLASLMDLWKKMNQKSKTVYPPLSGLKDK